MYNLKAEALTGALITYKHPCTKGMYNLKAEALIGGLREKKNWMIILASGHAFFATTEASN
jgi:hypothetical protein